MKKGRRFDRENANIPATEIAENGEVVFTNPYDKCLGCALLGNGCDGPNTMSMSLIRWCEWCYDLKMLRGWTNAKVSELSGVSLTTIDRVMAGTVSKDIMRSTCADITRTLIGSWGESPCALATATRSEVVYMDTPETLKALAEKTEALIQLQATIDKMLTAHAEEVRFIREDAQRKVDFLLAENGKKDRLIAKLAGLD